MGKIAGLCLIIVMVLGGCRCGCEQVSAPVKPICSSATKDAVFAAADIALTQMGFEIELLDKVEGIIETRPLTTAQFFEFWRHDNVGTCNWEEANLQDIRRTVRVQIKESKQEICIGCDAFVERFSLPEKNISGSGMTAALFTRSSGSLQKLELNRGQRSKAEWVRLSDDNQLAAIILEKIQKNLEK